LASTTKLLCFPLPQFNESWHLLVDWMTEVEQTLDTHKEIAVSQEEIKQQLTEQKVLHISGLNKEPMSERFGSVDSLAFWASAALPQKNVHSLVLF